MKKNAYFITFCTLFFSSIFHAYPMESNTKELRVDKVIIYSNASLHTWVQKDPSEEIYDGIGGYSGHDVDHLHPTKADPLHPTKNEGPFCVTIEGENFETSPEFYEKITNLTMITNGELASNITHFGGIYTGIEKYTKNHDYYEILPLIKKNIDFDEIILNKYKTDFPSFKTKEKPQKNYLVIKILSKKDGLVIEGVYVKKSGKEEKNHLIEKPIKISKPPKETKKEPVPKKGWWKRFLERWAKTK